MGIVVRWDSSDHSLLVVAFADPWLWDDFYAALRKIDELVTISPQPPRAIVSDYTHSRSIPANAFTHFHHIMEGVHQDPHETLMIMVGATGMWEAINKLYQVLYPQYRHRFRHVGNMAEARAVAARLAQDCYGAAART